MTDQNTIELQITYQNASGITEMYTTQIPVPGIPMQIIAQFTNQNNMPITQSQRNSTPTHPDTNIIQASDNGEDGTERAARLQIEVTNKTQKDGKYRLICLKDEKDRTLGNEYTLITFQKDLERIISLESSNGKLIIFPAQWSTKEFEYDTKDIGKEQCELVVKVKDIPMDEQENQP